MKVALAEQNKHDIEDVYKSVEGSPLKKFFWFLGGIIFILVSACGIYYVIQKKAKDNILQVVQKVETIISYNEVENVEISNTQNLTTKIKKIVSQNLNAGIKYIYIFKLYINITTLVNRQFRLFMRFYRINLISLRIHITSKEAPMIVV